MESNREKAMEEEISKQIPKVYVLFKFTDKPPGIAKLQAVYKPILPEDQNDAVTLLDSWIIAERQLVVRCVESSNTL